MTQTNNERELIERLALVDIDLRRSHNGFDFIASLSELEAFAKAYKTASDEKSISQNEHQESVTNLWEALGKWSAYLASNGEQANLAPPSWLIDAVSSATSPPKQIPDGWKLVPIESDEQMKDEARAFLTGLELGVKTFESMSEHLRLSGAYLPDWFLNSKGHINKMAKAHYIYESMLNAAPTNTEVGNETHTLQNKPT